MGAMDCSIRFWDAGEAECEIGYPKRKYLLAEEAICSGVGWGGGVISAVAVVVEVCLVAAAAVAVAVAVPAVVESVGMVSIDILML